MTKPNAPTPKRITRGMVRFIAWAILITIMKVAIYIVGNDHWRTLAFCIATANILGYLEGRLRIWSPTP